MDNPIADPDFSIETRPTDLDKTTTENRNVERRNLQQSENPVDYQKIKVCIRKTDDNDGKRIRANPYCEFCLKDQTHLKRHLQRKHRNRPEVQRMIRLSSTHQRSRLPMKGLQYSGDFIYNTDSTLNKGDLRVVKNSQIEDRDVSEYLRCETCNGMILVSNSTVHLKRCAGIKVFNSHDALRMGRKLFPVCHQKASSWMRQYVLAYMRRDKVFRAIQFDPLIIDYGNEISCHLRGHQHKDNICTQLRRLGKIKIELQVTCEKTDNLSNFLTPNQSEAFVQVIEKLANGGKLAEDRLEKPTVAQNMATLIKALANAQMHAHLKNGNHLLRDEVKDFLDCFCNDYRRRLSRLAAESHGERRRHRNVDMPSSQDMNALLAHLSNLRVKHYNLIQQDFSEQKYLALLKITLTSLQDDWKHLKKIEETTGSHYTDLNTGLQDLAQEYCILYTRGKLGRDIKLLVSADVQICINKLLEERNKLDISHKNRYLFALPQTPCHAIRHPSAYVLLQKFASECGANKPNLLTATRLRKQLETARVRLNLNDHEISDVARYMGHHPNIHRSYYRQNIVDRDIPLFLKFLNTALDNDTENMSEHVLQGMDESVVDRTL